MGRPRKIAKVDGSAPKPKKDPNAPKQPGNAYTIFYKRFLTEKPNHQQDYRALTSSAAAAWKGLSDEEKIPFQALAQEERAKYEVLLEEYRKTMPKDSYEAGTSSVKYAGEVPVFSTEFLAYNKRREADLRTLRREISTIEDDIENTNERVDELKTKLDKAHLKMSPAKRLAFEKERQILIWCREITCLLDKANLLPALQLSYSSTPEALTGALEVALNREDLASSIRAAVAGTVLENF